MKKKRIVFLVSRFLHGGIDTVLIDYFKMLSTDGRYDIGLGIGIQLDELEVFRNQIPASIDVHYLVKRSTLTSIYKQRMIKKIPGYKKVIDEALFSPIRRLILKKNLYRLAEKYDVVIDFDCTYYSFMKNIKQKKILYYHFSFKQTMLQNSRRMKRILRNTAYYDKVITICKEMQEEALELKPDLKDKIDYIYNPKDIDAVVEKSKADINDSRLNADYIVSVERLEESQKDITTLLKAFAIVVDTHPDLKLYIIGRGRDEELLKQRARDLGVYQNVDFIGFTDNPYVWMRHSRILVHSAKFEGLPTVLLEGIILEKLIVSTECPTGPKEILDYGNAGVLVPVGDERTMADGINYILDNKPTDKFIHNIRKQKLMFTYQEIQKKFNNIVINMFAL